MTCPYCHQDAPTIVRGVRTFCTACGAPRSIVDAPEAVNLAGQPAKVGGGVASVLGWVALVAGSSVALVMGAIANWIFTMTAGLWVGGFFGVLTLLVAIPLILGGKKLKKSGEDRARAAQEQAIFSLAAQRRGVLTVRDVARAVSIPEDQADALLTALAKRPDGKVSLEVDDNGAISYLFHDLLTANSARVRIAAQPWQAPGPARVATPPQEQPRVIDAELIDEENEEGRAEPPPRHIVR
jgi:hypothetical protein